MATNPTENRFSDESDETELPFFVKVGEKVVQRVTKMKALFKQQEIAIKEVVNWFISPKTAKQTAIIAMPTGSGKTGVICCLPYYLGEAVASKTLLNVDLRKPILVIAPGRQILSQLKENLELRDDNTFLLKRKILKSGKYHYIVKCIEKAEDIAPKGMGQYNICLVNAQKGHTRSKSEKTIYTWDDLPSDSFSVVMVDEAHHLPAKQWGDIISRFKASAKVVFLTATPFRADKRDISKDLADTGLAYHLSRQKAISQQIIRDTNPIDLTPQTPYDSQRVREKAIEMLPKIKARLEEKNSDPVQQLPDGTKHMAILIASNIEDALKIYEEWRDRFPEYEAEYIHSRKTEPEQKYVMKRLREGKITLLIIVQMLLEGFDHPPISIAAIATRIVSPVKFSQFIGRAQRVCRSSDGEPEPFGIKADVISDGFFCQGENYQMFENEQLIPTDINE